MPTAPATLPLSQIHLNEENPRLLKEPAFKKLVASLEEFPEMLSLRPVVIDEAGIALGGNMRTRAKSHLLALPKKKKEQRIQELVAARAERRGFAPDSPEAATYRGLLLELFNSDELHVIHAHGLSEEQKREFILKDNANFGEFDWDALANDPEKWGDAAQLEAFGLNLPKDWGQEPEVLDEVDLPDKPEPEVQQMTFRLTSTQMQDVQTAIALAQRQQGYDVETGNDNKNGNALAYICQLFNSQHNSDDNDSDPI